MTDSRPTHQTINQSFYLQKEDGVLVVGFKLDISELQTPQRLSELAAYRHMQSFKVVSI